MSVRHSWWTMKFSFTVSGRGCVISFLVFYRRNLVHLFIYFYFYLFFTYLFIYLFFVTRLWPSGIVFCWIHVWINFISCFKFGCFFFSFRFFFFSGLFPIWGVFQFWAFGLSSGICNLFIRHWLCTTVTSAGFSSSRTASSTWFLVCTLIGPLFFIRRLISCHVRLALRT